MFIGQERGRDMKKSLFILILSFSLASTICIGKTINLNSSILERFDGSRDDIVFDRATQLTWQTCSAGQTRIKNQGCVGNAIGMGWIDAKKLESSDWRLPTKDELVTIIDNIKNRNNDVPRIHGAIFYNVDEAKLKYWSNDTVGENKAWFINFGLGPIAGKADKKSEFAVRLVKGTFVPPAPEIRPPKDIYEFTGRRDDCNHFAGEFSGMPSDRERDQAIDKTMTKLRCKSVEADEKKLRRKYKDKADMLKWLDDRPE